MLRFLLFTFILTSCGKKEDPLPAFLVLEIPNSEETAYDFGQKENGGKGSAILTLTNYGEVEAIAIEETGLADPFAFTGGSFPGEKGSCAQTLAGGQSCALELSYSPTVEVYNTRSDKDAMVIGYLGGDLTSAELNLSGVVDYCSVKTSPDTLTNSAGSAFIAFETSNAVSAQSFRSTQGVKLRSVNLNLKIGASAVISDVVLRIRADSSGSPAAEDLVAVTLSGGSLSTSSTSHEFVLSTPLDLAANTDYWFIIDPGTNNISNGTIATYLYAAGSFSDNWAGGTVKLGTDSFGSWSAFGYDHNFALNVCGSL